MDKKVKRYFLLKQKQKEIELELNELRGEIISYCADQGVSDLEIGNYNVKVSHQERKEYDDNKVYEALPDTSIWRIISKVDTTKVSSLMKMNVISEDILKETYSIKNISVLQVEKK